MLNDSKVKTKYYLLLSPVLSLSLLWAASETLGAEPSPEQTLGIGIVQEKTKQGFPYISGGVGSEEREVMKQLGKRYNLKLSFADKTGPYVSEVNLIIEGPKGTEIVNTTTSGPWFYIQLPEGTYTIKATFKGKTKEMKALKLRQDKTVSQTLLWDVGEESLTR